MIALARVGLFAAFAALLSIALAAPAAAQKPFHRDDLADAAIKLEAQIKTESGAVTRPVAELRREADAAFQRNDFRKGLQVLGQITVAAPQDAGNWLRIARTVLQIRPSNNRERTTLLERSATAAYIAYQRTKSSAEEAESLLIISRSYADRQLWRPALDAMRLSLDLREVAEVRLQYERMREDHGFRILDYTVDADAASPRACFQFSEDLPGRRTDFSPFVAIAGQDRPALSVDSRQLCIEGLKHGERYNVTLRAGLPSTVREQLSRPAEFNIYVRDRKPFVRFAGRAYVLPRVGQRGIPVVSVNTSAVAIEIYRIGDRNIVTTVLGSDFQRTLDRYDLSRLAQQRGSQVWKGELAVEQVQNIDVTTAFPIGEAVPSMSAGVYVMVARAAGLVSEDTYEPLATQWFVVSDLGLAAFSGNDGVHAYVHSLETANASGNVEVRLLSRSNEVIATKRTNAAGYVQFEAALARGEGGMAPAMLVATDAKGDYAFLNLRSPAFDLTDRGVSGRPVPAGLDAFVYAERGVYRSGETVHVTALLRDAQGAAAAGVPLTLVVERPDGVEYRRATVADQGLGGRGYAVPLVASAPTGTWRVRAFTDPRRPAVGEATFMVEDYVPDRLEFEIASNAKTISRNDPAEVTLDGRYLYGAPAAALEIAGDVIVAPAAGRAGFPRYRFGVSDENVETTRFPLDGLPATDSNGKAKFTVNLDKVPSATRPLEARVVVRLAEAGGRAVERTLTLPVTANGPMIGVRPLFSGRSLGEGEEATFDVVVAAPDGTTLSRNGLRYELLRVETRYQWYRRDNMLEFEPVKTTRRIADGQLNVTAGSPARLSLPVQWGRYRLEVSTGERDGPVTSINFDAGWYADASADTPDMLEVALDKPEYSPGDTMTVAVTARTSGKVTLNVIGERLLATVTQDVQPGMARLRVPVGKDWGTGAYVVATLRRPLDAKAQRMPGRAIGVQWFGVDRKARSLSVAMSPPQLVRPNGSLRIPVKVGGLAAGEEARIVVTAVDVGILNLTNYKPPAPDDHYLGQRRLTADIRDLYGQLIDGMQGTRGQIRSGGDGAAELLGSPPSQKPLALHSGVVTVKPDGTAEVAFDIPDFAGTVRVMAVAWSKDKVGKATSDVTVRDSVVLTATLPRFLLNGDRATLHLDIDNVEGQAGEYRVEVRSDGVNVIGNAAPQTVKLNAKQRSALSLPLTAPGAGLATVTVRVSGPAGFAMERSYALPVKPATQILARRTVTALAAGEGVTLSNDVFGDLVPGTGALAVSVGLSSALDAAALLAALDRYPFGCTEQITSRALPLLYVNDLASAAHLALDGAVDQRIRESIDRVLARQGGNGAFGLWSAGGDDIWLDAYVTDFLTRARERKFEVPDVAFKLALQRLRNFVGNAEDPAKNGGRTLAYALYVLARNGAAPVGDLRYFVDTRLDDFATVIAKAQLAAALAMLGDKARADRVYAAALRSLQPQPTLEYGRTDFGSILRDAAALVTLASEGGAPRATVNGALERVEAARGLTPYISTQEQAWMVLAARAIAKDAAGVTLTVAGERHQGALNRLYRPAELAKPVRITNAGAERLLAVVTVTGAPVVPEPAAERGFKIERLYYTLDGQPADPSKARQNERFVVVLRVTEPQPMFGRVIVADYLPAGFEIDNPRLVSSGDTGKLSWIEDAVEPANAEFRDDRFTAAFNRRSNDPAVFTVAYVVRAVSPGRYVHPQAFVEDMYRPDRFGRTATGAVEVVAAK